MAQTIETVIAINARVGSGFGKVGATLTELGSMVNGVSQELINFGKDGVKVYREYEKSMTDAEVALSTTYGRGTKELKSVMGQLDVAATEWAATTIFHTNDVANAISEAAHAGWDFDRIMTGIPAAMQLAQAGSIDLSEAVNYIVKASNAAGIEFEDMGSFIDLWTFAANSSASTVDEFGQAMLRMGSTMRFAADPEELMTLIAVTANAGSVGSEAGTLIRNSMIRLIAPTEKADKAMAQLGATTLETAGLMEDEALQAANARLEAQGFSAYDAHGNLRNVLDIYRDLYVALGGVAGGFEQIDRNQDAMQILSAIFPTRTITEALTLLRGAAEGYDGLYESMKGGDAEGYGAYAAETMLDTLDGKIETFESKVERLKQLTGDELSEQVEGVLETAGDIVDTISGLDEGTFSALVSGLEVIATAGPGLLLAGSAFRLIGYALTPAGGIGLGLIALTSAAAALKELRDADFAQEFGDMELDTAGIQSYVSSLGEGFKNAYTEVDKFKTALDNSVTSYQTASSTFSSALLQDMLTNAKLSDTDIETLTNLGNDMYLAVQSAISNSAAASMSYWQVLFGGDGEAEVDPAYQEIIDLTNQAYEDAMAEAEGISQGMRAAMTSAFADGTVSEEEYQKILSYMKSYNDAMARAAAEAQSEEDYIKMNKWLQKAQTASWDDIKEIASGAMTERDTILADQEDRYLTEKYRLQYRGADEETLSTAEEKFRQQQMQTKAQYDDFLLTLWTSQMQQSGLAEGFEGLSELTDQYLSGALTAETVQGMITGQYGASKYAGQAHWDALWNTTDREKLGKYLGYAVNSYGGQEGISESIAWYEEQGNTEMASSLRRLYAMEQLINNFGLSRVAGDSWWESLGDDFSTTNQGEYVMPQANREAFEQTAGIGAGYGLDAARTTIAALSGGKYKLDEYFTALGEGVASESVRGIEGAWSAMSKEARNEYENMFAQVAQQYDLEAVAASMSSALADEGGSFSPDVALWDLLYGDASKHADDFLLHPKVDTSELDGMGADPIEVTATPVLEGEEGLNIDPIPVPVQPYTEGTDAADALQDQGVDVQVTGDTTELQATIDGADGQTLLEYVSGDATNLSLSITDQDGKTLVENVTGNASSLAAIIQSYNGRTVTVNIRGRKLFAEGGRATEASIFGEAGPEWAIPEEHSQRTAELLDAARAASGFTWPEILGRFGGLNADPDNRPTTLIYSPTINAADVTGVEQALQEDKKRLEKWFKERQMHDEAVVYT